MLIKCPECELQVSDKAASCPHCGMPLRKDSPKVPPRKNRKRRLPNGFGQITEIKGKFLRKPFRVMVTVGKDDRGRPICKPLKPDAYFETYNEAYAALVEYNKSPYDLDKSITVREVYELWSGERYKEISAAYANILENSWKYCSAVYDMRFIDLRIRHIDACINNGTRELGGSVRTPPPSIRSNIKILFNQLFDYAVRKEIVQTNISRSFAMSATDRKACSTVNRPHQSYTDEEMQKLWTAQGKSVYADMLLVQCYSGWRPKEMCELLVENVDLEKWTFIGGMKTEAGTNRTVPIHNRIKDIVARHAELARRTGSKYLFSINRKPIVYSTLYMKQKELFSDLEINAEHRPHDGRVQFVTMAKRCGVDEYAIKAIVGHYISDITEKVYTKRDPEWLTNEINKIV